MRKVLEICKNTWVILTLVLILAAILRLPLMQYIEFKGDEALTLFLASRPIFHHPFPPAALTSSAGILNFPLINYLLFPILVFTLYPPAISFVIALLNVLTIGGFFLLLTKYHGRLTGFLASCIIAVSPWMILYSRKIWEQDFLLPLGLPFFLSMYKILEGKRSYWFLFGLTSMLLLQIHQLAIIIPFLIFICLLFKKQKPLWKRLILGLAVGLIPTIPYFLYAISTHFSNFHPTNSLFARFTFHDLTIFLRPLQILSIGNFHTEMGNDFAVLATKFRFIYLISKFSYLAYLLIPIGAFFFWVKNTKYRFFIIVAVSATLLYFIFGIESLMHYYILLVPFLSIIIAYFLSLLIRAKIFKWIGLLIAVAYFVSLIFFDYGFLAFLSENHGFGGDYGGGYVGSEKEAQIALKKFENSPNYKELYLYYFLPIEYFHGYMPIGKMIFPYNELRQNEQAKEKQFIKEPTSPLLRVEIFAYYTQNQNPSWNYVVNLKEKVRKQPLFYFIYQQVLDEYLSSHLKRLYDNPDFLLLYPQHWKSEEIKNGIVLSDENIAITITKLVAPTDESILLGKATSDFIAGKEITKTTCTNDSLWCGTVYAPMLLRANYYLIYAKPISTHAKTDKNIQKYGQDVLDEVTASLIPLR